MRELAMLPPNGGGLVCISPNTTFRFRFRSAPTLSAPSSNVAVSFSDLVNGTDQIMLASFTRELQCCSAAPRLVTAKRAQCRCRSPTTKPRARQHDTPGARSDRRRRPQWRGVSL
jgi:hypothetical protein